MSIIECQYLQSPGFRYSNQFVAPQTFRPNKTSEIPSRQRDGDQQKTPDGCKEPGAGEGGRSFGRSLCRSRVEEVPETRRTEGGYSR